MSGLRKEYPNKSTQFGSHAPNEGIVENVMSSDLYQKV